LTTGKHEKSSADMLKSIRDSLSFLASSKDGENGCDEKVDEENTKLGKLSEDD